jgi:hypothetical protein
MMNLVTGILGFALLIGFLGFMVVWIKSVPLTVIVLVTVGLALWDFLSSLRQGNNR